MWLSFHTRRVVHVAVVGGDVEVAQHDQRGCARSSSRQPVVHGLQPAQLVGVLVGAHVLAVDHVQVDDAQVADGRREHALLLVLEAGDADLHVAARDSRDSRATPL